MKEFTMRRMLLNQVTRLYRDETGGEVLEYAIVSGLIIVAAISVIGKVGGKVLAKWNSLNSSM
jgi:pilus assembly protein Flp/PilA